jgi:pimeloyl-ACP methyl ester carboxylesterase
VVQQPEQVHGRSGGVIRLAAAGAALALVAPGLATMASADPSDPWDYEKYDCLNDRFNPLDENGNRTGTGPEPGTPEWTAFNDSHVACTDQRDSDRNQHAVPDAPRSAATYGQDPYRQPADHGGVRFHVEDFDVTQIPTVPSAEAYRPCTTAPGDCADLPSGLERFDGPYPVVVVMHGVIADKSQHRFNTQTFAENGYLAVGVDGIGGGYVPGTSLPSSQRCQNAGDVLDWLASDASGEWGQLADLSRVAVVGHSQGGSCALGYQGDPRVDTIVAWDISDQIGASNCVAPAPCQPVMIQRTDGGFSSPQSYASGYPAGRDRGQAGYRDSKARDMDFLHITMRDTVHTEWNGRGSGLSGNRLFEQASNYYNVAWLDLQLKGKLVLDDAGRVVPQGGRKDSKERAFRQAQALSAFDRLTSKTFLPGTIDKHNISMGFYDPEQAEASGDRLYGGNVPYVIEGTWTQERLSPFYRSYCTLSVPDYLEGSDGTPGSPDAATADSGDGGDMRDTGCQPSFRSGPGNGKGKANGRD